MIYVLRVRVPPPRLFFNNHTQKGNKMLRKAALSLLLAVVFVLSISQYTNAQWICDDPPPYLESYCARLAPTPVVQHGLPTVSPTKTPTPWPTATPTTAAPRPRQVQQRPTIYITESSIAHAYPVTISVYRDGVQIWSRTAYSAGGAWGFATLPGQHSIFVRGSNNTVCHATIAPTQKRTGTVYRGWVGCL